MHHPLFHLLILVIILAIAIHAAIIIFYLQHIN